MKEEKKKSISIISIILLVMLISIIVYKIASISVIREKINDIFSNKNIEIEKTEYTKNNFLIKSEKTGNKEVVFITNNNSTDVYGVNVIGMFYDNNGLPINTEEKQIIFIESGKTVVTIIECKDDNGKAVEEYSKCIVDIIIDENTDSLKNAFYPLKSKGDKIMEFKNIQNHCDENNISYLDFDIVNVSESRCRTISLSIVFYKNNKPIYAQNEMYSSITSGKSKKATVLFTPKDYDDVKIYIEEAYRYSYQ